MPGFWIEGLDAYLRAIAKQHEVALVALRKKLKEASDENEKTLLMQKLDECQQDLTRKIAAAKKMIF